MWIRDGTIIGPSGVDIECANTKTKAAIIITADTDKEAEHLYKIIMSVLKKEN